MAKKPKVEKDRSERWLLTYSDLMNLLLILFIILYASSKADAAKMAQVAEAVRKGFNGGVDTVMTANINSSSSRTSSGSIVTSSGALDPYWDTQKNQYDKFLDDLIKLLKNKNLIDKVQITADDRGIVISLRDNVLFTPGSADLNQGANVLVKQIGVLLKPLNFTQIIIEGHTDSDPIVTSNFKDNRDLSSERANNVARVLESSGIKPQKIASIGYGQYRPVAPNDTPANKAKNRRVVITILRKTITADEITSVNGTGSALSASSQSSASQSSSKSTASSK